MKYSVYVFNSLVSLVLGFNVIVILSVVVEQWKIEVDWLDYPILKSVQETFYLSSGFRSYNIVSGINGRLLDLINFIQFNKHQPSQLHFSSLWR